MNQHTETLRTPDANLPIGLGSVDNRACGPLCEADTMTTKKCFKCGRDLSSESFSKNRSKHDGLQSWCKECERAQRRANKDVRAEQGSWWYQQHRALTIVRSANYQKTHPQKAREYARRTYQRRRVAYQEYGRVYREQHPEAARARSAVNTKVRSGKLVKPDTCQCCGRNAEEWRLVGHHEDYSKPLDVLWVCHSCHKKLHATVEERQ